MNLLARTIVALGSSALLTGGLGVAVSAVSTGTSAAVIAAGSSSSNPVTSNVTIIDP